MSTRGDNGKTNARLCKKCGGSRGGPGDSGLVSIIAVRMDGDGPGVEERVATEDILFAFTSGAVGGPPGGRRHPAILAKWTPKFSFPQAVLFLRTRSGIYRSYLRTLEDFKRRVSVAQFDRVSQSVIANLTRVHSTDLTGQGTKTLTYAVEKSEIAWPFESVVIGRDYLNRIRWRFGIPPRPRSIPRPPERPPANEFPARADDCHLSTESCGDTSEG